jgi:hypothetical protein
MKRLARVKPPASLWRLAKPSPDHKKIREGLRHIADSTGPLETRLSLSVFQLFKFCLGAIYTSFRFSFSDFPIPVPCPLSPRSLTSALLRIFAAIHP